MIVDSHLLLKIAFLFFALIIITIVYDYVFGVKE
jgi:hypothetical protein